ncbi:MAG: hypothetical protein IPK16_10045 [Anaerolineales bacterium]|nr:hypothetical protein [Anaerolineales bacterium]
MLFLLNTSCAWQWMNISDSDRAVLESAVDATISPQTWTLSAIRRRLAQHEKLDTNDVVTNEVYRVTGGWPTLLDLLFDRCGKETDMRAAILQLGAQLGDPDSDISSQMRRQLGITEPASAARAFKFIVKDGEGKLIRSIDFALIGGEPATASQCNVYVTIYCRSIRLLRRWRHKYDDANTRAGRKFAKYSKICRRNTRGPLRAAQHSGAPARHN